MLLERVPYPVVRASGREVITSDSCAAFLPFNDPLQGMICSVDYSRISDEPLDDKHAGPDGQTAVQLVERTVLVAGCKRRSQSFSIEDHNILFDRFGQGVLGQICALTDLTSAARPLESARMSEAAY